MPAKRVHVAEIGEVALYKRRGVKSVRLSITHDGGVRVTLPSWAPYRLGIEFAHSKADWILQRRIPGRLIAPGDRVGKAHRFVFVNGTGSLASVRLNGTDINVYVPEGMTSGAPEVQKAAATGAVKALKKEATQLLPQRLEFLARQHGFEYRSVAIKRLKSRWGSCNEHTDIVLNCFLMQLPWHLIDYVLLHELTHTKVLRHGEPFWNELGKYLNDLQSRRKEIKQYQPALLTIDPAATSAPDKPAALPIAIETA